MLQGRLPQPDSSLRGPPARRRVPEQLPRRRDKRESVRSRARAPATWDDGVDGALLCHLLFSVHDDLAHGAAMLRFRCGPVHGQRGTNYCHKHNMPHYRGLRDIALNAVS